MNVADLSLKYFEVEPLMNAFVISIGGELGDPLFLSEANRPKNADYIFKNDNVIAELKCFKKDLFSFDEDAERRNRLFQRWIDSGYFEVV